MKVVSLEISEVKLIEPSIYKDERGLNLKSLKTKGAISMKVLMNKNSKKKLGM